MNTTSGATPGHVTVEIFWSVGYGRAKDEVQTLHIGQVSAVELMQTMKQFERTPGFAHWRKVSK